MEQNKGLSSVEQAADEKSFVATLRACVCCDSVTHLRYHVVDDLCLKDPTFDKVEL